MSHSPSSSTLRLSIAAIVTAIVAGLAAVSAGADPGGSQAGLVRGHIVDYAKPPGAGGGTAGTAMATDFKLAKQRWPSGATVQYKIDSSGCSGCGGSVVTGFNHWQPRTGVTLSSVNNPSQTNPCTGQPNSVSWVSIDGPGGILAETFPCYYLGTNQMAGFEVQFDVDDPWSTCSSVTACQSVSAFSVEAVATHESGHVIGLNHVASPRDARLTMYPYISESDYGFATLGCGDDLGAQTQYGNSGFVCTANGTVPVD
jgi:Matrixin